MRFSCDLAIFKRRQTNDSIEMSFSNKNVFVLLQTGAEVNSTTDLLFVFLIL